MHKIPLRDQILRTDGRSQSPIKPGPELLIPPTMLRESTRAALLQPAPMYRPPVRPSLVNALHRADEFYAPRSEHSHLRGADLRLPSAVMPSHVPRRDTSPPRSRCPTCCSAMTSSGSFTKRGSSGKHDLSYGDRCRLTFSVLMSATMTIRPYRFLQQC
ncbi:hypothetical protein B0H11DRAFT_2189095 [Mycena galericulata]|nr:hypothetical protein B0H11DRAFT_2189095 [Mycena galericulata]